MLSLKLIMRRKTKSVGIGDLFIGGDSPVSVQTMWKTPLTGEKSPVLHRLSYLKSLGCQIVRFAVPNIETARFLGSICADSPLPLVADIHYDYRIALACLDFAFGKIRINPGNIGEEWKVREVAMKAQDRGVPIRIGVNGGSLPEGLTGEKDQALAMVKAAEMEIDALEKTGFSDIIISLKSSSITTTIDANTRFSEVFNYPLHIGVTEAGPLISGVVKNSIALSTLFQRGIGDTVRVSLSGTEEEEIIAAREILRAENRSNTSVDIVSCPTCNRASFDVQGFLQELGDFLYRQQKDISVAIMGCPVNGLGEASHADVGITGLGNTAVIFRKGKEVCKVTAERAVERFKEEFERL